MQVDRFQQQQREEQVPLVAEHQAGEAADAAQTGRYLRLFCVPLLRDGEQIYRTYFTDRRGVEMLGSVWSLLDVTPFGRQET